MKEIISRIENKIWQSVSDENKIGLLDGLSGIAIFYNYLNEVYENVEYQEKLLIIIDKIDNLISEEIKTFSLCSGLSGYGLVLLTLNDKNIQIDEEYFESIDLILLEHLNDQFKKNNYDFLHGALGIMLYFLERYKANKTEFLAKILNDFTIQLCNKISLDLKGVLIRKTAYNDECYYLGTAHGVSGLINFLIYLADNFNELKIDISESLKACIYFLKSHKKYESNSKQFYPNLFLTETNTAVNSLLGWCQGDLGISNSFYNAGLFLNDNSLKDEAIELMENTKNISLKESKVKDFAICHGSSGILIQYFLASLKLGMDYSKEVEIWFSVIKEQTKDFEIFLAHKGKGEYEDNMGILKGAAGLGVILLTIENGISPNWLRFINLH
jgi:lantibiotic modifying enzyme